MIHELDLLDVASYIVRPDERCELSISKLIKLKNRIEEHFASLEVNIEDDSIICFQHKFSDCVVYENSTVSIEMTAVRCEEIKKMRTPYLEHEILELLTHEHF